MMLGHSITRLLIYVNKVFCLNFIDIPRRAGHGGFLMAFSVPGCTLGFPVSGTPWGGDLCQDLAACALG